MVVSEFHCATLSMSNVKANCDVEIIISGNKPPALFNEVFIKKIQYGVIFHERTYYHLPYNHLSAYTKYHKYTEATLLL